MCEVIKKIKIKKRKFKQSLSTIPPMSTKGTTISRFKSLYLRKDHNRWCRKSELQSCNIRLNVAVLSQLMFEH
jgi:hypothetical protein